MNPTSLARAILRRSGVLLALAVLTFAVSASAGDMNYHGTFCGKSRNTVLVAGPELTLLSGESWGIQTPDSGFAPWKNASNHCVSYIRVSKGQAHVKGACLWTDADGDTFTGEFEIQPGQPGQWTFLGGTGKWKGVQGGGTFKTVGRGKPYPDGTRTACTTHSGKLTVP